MYEINKDNLIKFLKSEERSIWQIAIITRTNAFTIRAILSWSRPMSDKMFARISTVLLDYYEDRSQELLLSLKK